MKFKTNAKCGGCTAAITKALESIAPAEMWEFDLESPDRTLTFKGEEDPELAGRIIRTIENAGFKASEL